MRRPSAAEAAPISVLLRGPEGVQFHDILYKTFRDILYTPARRCRGLGWGKTASARGRGMAWRTSDGDEQRMRFVVAASRREKSLTELCAEFEISRPTGYGWLKRYQARGIAGMQEESRRPHHIPVRTAAAFGQRGGGMRR